MKNTNTLNFSYEFTPTESTAGGTLLCIADHLAYQRRNDLNLYEKNYLESKFVETTNPTKTSIILVCIYRHSTMDLNEFKEQKTVFLLGDFNVDLFKSEQHNASNEFLDSLSSNVFNLHYPTNWNYLPFKVYY